MCNIKYVLQTKENYEKYSNKTKESCMLYTINNQKKDSDLALKTAVILMLPYILWLAKYTDSYIYQFQGVELGLNYDGIMYRLHNILTMSNVWVHESGHGICYILNCPMFITVINGTIFQLALPIIFIVHYKKKNILISQVGYIWLAQNLVYVAWYMSTAQVPDKYPSFLGEGVHDFWYIFTQLGVLQYSEFISGFVRFFTVLLLLFSYAYLFYMVFTKKLQKSV